MGEEKRRRNISGIEDEKEKNITELTEEHRRINSEDTESKTAVDEKKDTETVTEIVKTTSPGNAMVRSYLSAACSNLPPEPEPTAIPTKEVIKATTDHHHGAEDQDQFEVAELVQQEEQ